ncbi:MAG: hypothetical protein ACK4UU_08535, partial [Fimbriimonadales bacterium]
MEVVNEALEHLERLAQLMAQHGASRLELRDGAIQITLARATEADIAAPLDAMPPLFLSGYAQEAAA